MKKVVDGKLCSFEDVYRQYKDLMFKYAHQFENPVHDVDDLYQIASIALYQAYKNYNNSMKVKFITVATNYIFNAMTKQVKFWGRSKRKIVHKCRSLSDIIVSNGQSVELAETIDSGVDTEEMILESIILHQAYESLTDMQKEVFLKLVLCGGSQSMAAQTLNISQARVWQQKEAIKNKFKKCGVI